jgi:hypothetical protein
MNNMPIIIVILAGLCILSVCDDPPPPKPPQPPVIPSNCELQHVVGRGETQWMVADRYAGGQNKHLWLRLMRRASYLATDDDHLYPGQVLCVAW